MIKTQAWVYISALILFLAGCASYSPTFVVDEPIENYYPSTFIKGQTENGTNYFLNRSSYHPGYSEEDTVQFIFMVKAGSVLEEDNQLGLAHFVEHMAFNGTEKFSGNTLIYELQKRGARFGTDFGAYTGYTSTVFSIILPNSLDNIAFALDIIKEWATNLSYDEEEIEKEKPVVLAEVRGFKNKEYEHLLKTTAFYLNDSKYGIRSPGGKMDTIATAPREVIKKYYDDWYKPNLMGIFVSGDIDTSFVEEEINKRFSYEDTHATLPHMEIPLGTPNTLHILRDEHPIHDNAVTMRFIIPREKVTTIQDAVDATVLTRLTADVLNTYLDNLVEEEIIKNSYVTLDTEQAGYYVFFLKFDMFKDTYQEGLEAIFHALASLKKNKHDIFDLVEAYMEDYEYSHISLHSDAAFPELFIEDLFLIDNSYKDAFEAELHKASSPTVMRNKINYIMSQSDMKIVVTAEAENIIPSNATIEEWYQTILLANDSPLPPFSNDDDDEIYSKIDEVIYTLLDNIEAGSIVSQELLPKYDNVHHFELSNGIRVEYNQSSYFGDSIEMNIHGLGGLIHYFDKDNVSDFFIAYNYNSFAPSIHKAGFTQKEMGILEQEYYLDSDFSLGPSSQEFNISGSTEYLDAFFGLAHLLFTSASMDAEQYPDIAERINSSMLHLRNHAATYHRKKFIFGEYWGADPSLSHFDEFFGYELRNEDIVRAFEVYQHIISTPQNFTFAISGNAPVEEIKEHLELYIASIPTTDTPPIQSLPMAVNNSFDIVESHHNTAQSLVSVGWDTLLPKKQLVYKDFLLPFYTQKLLENVLMDTIREEESGVYFIVPFIYYYPEPRTFYDANQEVQIRTLLYVHFGSLSSRAEELKEKSIQVVEKVGNNAISQELFLRTRGEIERWITSGNYSNEIKNDSTYFQTHMMRIAGYNKDDFLEAFYSITPKDIQDFIASMTRTADNVSYILTPPAEY